ncbi:MAG: exo-alpha-sialidase [Candidatus Anammoximicrobium sp.]|nr:exo-alpha-sialidase [Candidatus Anammoximicrobium sp.]
MRQRILAAALVCAAFLLSPARPGLAGEQPAAVPASAAATPAGRAPAGRLIWDATRIPDREKTRLEFPDLIRFRGDWYCSFREGEIHGNHPSGRGRVIRSADGEEWETAALMEWDGGDVRDPRLSVTADGQLMLNSSIYFTSACRSGTPPNEAEAEGVTRQSVTWLSADGQTWTSVYACPTGVNSWRWAVSWHGGMGYSVAYTGKDSQGTLYRTRDGKSWRALRGDFFPEGRGSEAALAFAPDGTVCCLLRDGRARGMIGVGTPPDYQVWQWKDASVDWRGDGQLRPASDVWKGSVGGPKIVRLHDGRFLGIARIDGRVTLFWVDPEQTVFKKFVEVDGTSYPGLVEHEKQLWVTYGVGDAAGIFLTKVPVSE